MDNNTPHDIITSAEQLVASLWQAEKDEETPPAAPPGSEALEDEIAALQAVVDLYLQEEMRQNDAMDMDLSARILDVDRFIGADVPVWGVGLCIEGHCSSPECKGIHHAPKRVLVAKDSNGGYVVLKREEIMNVREQHKECAESQFGGAIRINLDEIIGQAVRDTVSEKVKKHVEESMQDDEEDEDELPPAAKAEPVTVDPDPPEITAVLPVVSQDNTPPPWMTEDTAPRPVYTIDPRQNNDQPGLLRRAWNWLWSDDDE